MTNDINKTSEDLNEVDYTQNEATNSSSEPATATNAEASNTPVTKPDTSNAVTAIEYSGATDGNKQLSRFGITSERLAAAQTGVSANRSKATGDHRSYHIDTVKQHYKAIIAGYGGVTCLSAPTVLQWLVANGFGKTANGTVMRGANAIGDVLGQHGLSLPWRVVAGKKRYALDFVNATAAEKIEAHEQLCRLSALELRALPVA